MRTRTILPAAAVALGVVLRAPLPAHASFAGTDVFLPSVGKGPGASGSQWTTTLWIHNPTGASANLQLFFLLRNQPNPSPQVFNDAIPPGQTLRFPDAMGNLFGASGFGAFRVTSDQKLVVNSRIYSVRAGEGDRDSVGQFFAAVPASFAIATGQSASILGVYQTAPQQDSEYRTNFGFVETTGLAATVRVTALAGDGAVLGSKDYALGGHEPRQVNVSDLLPGIDSDNVRLQVEVLSGPGRVVAFGSLLANASSDPSTLEMSYRGELLGGGAGGAVVTDQSLTGDGTTGAPLGIADAGVTPQKISAAGSSSGQVLTSNGSSVSWQGGGGLTLPYSGSGSSTGTTALFAVRDSGTAMAIDGESSGHTGIGVRGRATGTGSQTNYGGYFEAYGTSGRGVAGAVNGSQAAGVWGYAAAGGLWGVLAEAEQSGALALLARNKQSGNYVELGAGGRALHAVSFTGAGVYSQSSAGDGVAGESSITAKSGVYGANTSAGGFGVYGRNTSTGNVGYLGGAYGVYGESSGAYAAAFRGNVAVMARSNGQIILELGEGLDYAEGFDVTAGPAIAPGSVLVIDPDSPGRLALSREAYDRRVAGVVAGARGLGSGVRLGADRFDHDVALAGRVYCNVDATYGEIRAGDLLTTSPTPGHAMVAADHDRRQGAILGKAMEPLAAGRRGQVLILVTLQ